jgi:ATP-dependent RNA helicase DeaD
VRETLAEIGYTHPTPVQIAVWEPATRGKDAVVQARTGTGKTAAFGLPIVDHLVRRSAPQVQVLALCPTRELALQVATEIERLGKRRSVKVTAIYGGAPMQRQIDQIADGAQVIVGTPGRVLDHLRRGTLDPRHVRMLVLDEADEMLSMGFEREVTAILDTLPKDRQTLLFSATVPPDIERMAKKLRSPEFLTLSGDHVGALEIEHFVYMVASDKLAALVRIIEVENPEGAVIFCNTKDETERVAQTLARQGYDADWLNGDLPQSDREKVMSATREGRLRFLVATDVAARGIDISHLTHVINYDFPQDAESYVHRTGRTGRAGRTGTAIALITPHDVGGLYLLRLTYKIRPIERQIPTEGELKTRAEADLVTMLVEAFGGPSQTGVHPDDLALARRLLTHEQCDVIFAGLLRDHLGARPTAKQEAATARRATRVAPPPPPPPPAPRMALPAPKPAVSSLPTHPDPPLRAVASPPAHVDPPVSDAAKLPVAHPPAPTVEAATIPAPPPHARPERRPDERRGRDDRRDRGDDRRPPPAPGGPLPRRPRREDHVPVSAAQGSHEGHADPRHPPQRHADFTTWQPPEEEGDDRSRTITGLIARIGLRPPTSGPCPSTSKPRPARSPCRSRRPRTRRTVTSRRSTSTWAAATALGPPTTSASSPSGRASTAPTCAASGCESATPS